MPRKTLWAEVKTAVMRLLLSSMLPVRRSRFPLFSAAMVATLRARSGLILRGMSMLRARLLRQTWQRPALFKRLWVLRAIRLLLGTPTAARLDTLLILVEKEPIMVLALRQTIPATLM